MRTRRFAVPLLLMLAAGLLFPPAASAGGWAETILDPPPATIEAKTTYTFGFWVLQHGSYPYQGGDLGRTALRATDEKGQLIEFTATPSATGGHFSAEVVFPHDGTWNISGYHEVLMPDESVATVTVPGSVTIAMSDVSSRAPYEWGAVRPSFPPTDPKAENGAPVPAPAVAPAARPARQEAAAEEPGATLPMGLVIAGGVVTIGFAAWLARRAMRSTSS